jgi:cytochrome c nitrite reductase small subunit
MVALDSQPGGRSRLPYRAENLMATTGRSPALTALRVVAAAFVGVAVGVTVYTAGYSELTSYLGEDPVTCTNCHVMQAEYDAWMAGSHANVATCNDCHVPHDSLIQKYTYKAYDGIRHATAFTFGTYPENIVIADNSLRVTNNACLTCHANITDQMYVGLPAGETISCVRCHAGVGHDD